MKPATNRPLASQWAIPLILLLASSLLVGCNGERGMGVTKAAARSDLMAAGEPLADEFELPAIELKTEILPVQAIAVYSSGGGDTRWYPGVAVANPNNKFSFEIGGVISEINFKKGDKILFERVLAKLDPMECLKKIDRLKTELARAELNEHRLSMELRRLKARPADEEDNNGQIAAARDALKTARKDASSKRKELQAAFVELGRHEMRFTQRGRVSSAKAKAGDTVETGQTIFEFDLNDPLQITVDIPAVFLSQIGLSSIGRAKFSGKKGVYPVDVINIGEWSKAPDARIPVTVKLRNPYSYLRAGTETLVAFKFDMRSKRKHYIIPPGSTLEDGDGRFIYVVVPGDGAMGKVERRQALIGSIDARGEEVLNGLKNGEIIVVDPDKRLADGMTVRYK